MHKIKQHKQLLSIIVVLLLAAFLRLYNISGFMVFLGDEGRDVLVAYNILHGHLTLLGPISSVGNFYLGPVYYYLMAPFLWLFNYDPVGPAVMIALFGILTVFLIYKIGKEFFGFYAGIIASLLYAVSPLVITYSRSSWNPNMMPISTLLCLYFLYKAVSGKNWKLFILSGFILGLILQFHYLGTFVGAIIFVYLLVTTFIEKNSLSTKIINFIKRGLQLFVGFLIGLSPFLLFEARHDFLNIRNIFKFVFHSSGTGAGGNFFATVGNIFFRFFGRIATAYPVPADYHKYNPGLLEFWQIETVLLGIFSIVMLYRVKNKLQLLLILCWFAVGVLMFGFYKKSIYDYYLEFLFPLPFLLIGNAFSILFNSFKKQQIVKIVVVFVVAFLFFLNLYFANPIGAPADFQKDQAKTIADFVLSKTNNQPYNFALITSGNSDYAYRYYMTIEGHVPVTIQPPYLDPKRTSVTNQLMVVCESVPCHPLGWSLFEVAGFGRADIAERWNVSVVEVDKLVHYKGK